MKYGMLLDMKRCTGCYSCVVACKQYFNTRMGVDYNQGQFVEWAEYPNAHRRYISTMCNHCDDAPCHAVCPTGATSKAPEGPVLTNDDLCIGCGECVRACPYGQRFVTETEPGRFKAEKCTLCQDRLAQGREPLCVALCPAHCRIFGDLDDPESELNYYIKLHGAKRVANTSVYYVLPEGLPESELPQPIQDIPKAEDERAAIDGLLKAQDWIRKNPPKSSEPEYRYSNCAMCNHVARCGVKVLVRDGKAVRMERREEYGNELLCPMGNAQIADLYSPNRVLYPLRRTNPKGERSIWKRITWDEALSEIAEKLNGVKAKYGADKVLFMTGDPKEPRSVLQRLAYTFGSPNFGTESSTCFTATELAIKLMYGVGNRGTLSLSPGAPPDINDTKVAIFWAHNPGTSAAFSYDKLKTVREYSKCKYIIVDSRVTSTTENFADVHLQIRPGTDGALALFFGHWLISHGKYDKAFVRDWAHGFDDYARLCPEYTIERTAEICGVPQEKLRAAGDILVNQGAPITIKVSAAFPHHTNGVDNYRAIMLLIPLTGSLDVEGGHIIANEPLNENLGGGTFEFARNHELLPGLKHLRADRDFAPVWADMDVDGSVQLNALPEYVKEGKIRAALALGLNCMMWPQSHEYQQAFADMEFVAAADFRDNTWTHNYVDMLLPAAMSFERSAPLMMVGRRVFLREAILKPQGEARSDHRIVCDIGTALGYGDVFFGGGENADEACVREMLRTLDGKRRITLEELRAESPEGIVIPMSGPPQFRKWEKGLLRTDGKPGFATPSGKVEFASEVLREHGIEPLPVYREPTYSPASKPELAKKYPLIMMAGARVPFYSNAKHRELPVLRQFMPEPVIRIGAADARERGLSAGDMVRITSPVNDEGIVAKLEITNTLKPSCIDMLHGWEQANVNELIPRDFDPISRFPPFKEGLCQVELAG
ncbi:formate dehydrogenase [Clostridia bacterium]|nr:formate dehydrogenase [Clostridia bacterium]